MKLYIPEIGDQLKLTSDWRFKLNDERRNKSLIEHLGFKYSDYKSTDVTLPADTVLQIDRIYIRQGLSEFSSISFYVKSTNNKGGYFGRPSTLRFWASLKDCNNIEFVHELLISDAKPKLIFSNVVDYSRDRNRFIYFEEWAKLENKLIERHRIVDSKKYDANLIFIAQVTADAEYDNIEKLPNSLMNSYSYICGKMIKYRCQRKLANFKFELLDKNANPLGVEANSRSVFIKKVNEYYNKSN